MKALLYKGPETIEYADVPKPGVRDDEVLMKIRSVGICGTDLHIYAGKMNVPTPLIMGHEFSGTVESVGKSVANVKAGDRVVGEHVVPCRTCHYCLIGKPNLCPNAKVIGLDRPGALAEYLAIPADMVYKIPDELDFDEAALIEPLTIALYAIREAGLLLDKDVAVIGQGPIGLLLDQAVKTAGGNVIGIETQAHRLVFAKEKKWIDNGIDASKDDVVKRIHELCPGGVDVSIEAVGRESTAQMALDIAMRAGRVLLLGVFEQPSKLDLMSIVKKELHVHGSWTCAFSFPDALDLVAKGKIDLKSLITHRYAAKDGAQAFKDCRGYADNRIKTVINF
jgi:L-iditol 2-dehydrogenase